jgi:hypothetical protein
MSTGNRGLSFKYELKAADQAISRGAFSDGLGFVEAASLLAVTKPELKVMQDVIARALRDINRDIGPTLRQGSTTTLLAATARKVIHGSGGSGEGSSLPTNAQTKGIIAAYTALQEKTQASLDKFAKNNPGNGSSGARGGGDARLNWQPSYVASHMGDASEEDDKAWKAKNACCSIS